LEAVDEKVKLAASKWLHEETAKQLAERERLEKTTPARRESDQEIIAELRALYAKALPERQPPLLETVSDVAADGQAGGTPAEDLPQVSGPLGATVEVSSSAELIKPPVQYRMERIPGHFPPKYRRVPIEP
jgi:hypothetical protein